MEADYTRLGNLTGAVALGISTAMVEAVEAETGLSAAEVSALTSLANWADGLSIERLREVLHMSQPGCARLVDRLVRARLVRRGVGRDDRRVTTVALTAAGRRSAAAALSTRERVVQQWLNGLGTADRRALLDVLQRLVATGVTDAVDANRRCRLCDAAGCAGDTDGCPVTAAVRH